MFECSIKIKTYFSGSNSSKYSVEEVTEYSGILVVVELVVMLVEKCRLKLFAHYT